ncbi:DoxX family membrane protein [Kallotenue papyrolyticum]|uniref:DoxX family membrane protein n=1 Tax=Kallotenue papyrolyticum TaxID=1325125 RepID=UPI000478543B|nr:DoxX family membrane protein [Kallotenue papyrolyticum]
MFTRWYATFDQLDRRVTRLMARYGIVLLRVGLGLVFFWFGVLKFVPGLSPAQDLATRTIELLTFGLIPPAAALLILAAWETLIGLGLISGRFLRTTILLLLVQMAGTITPLFLFPGETFTVVPIAPTLEGQYIIKNIVLISAALVIGATVRGGRVVADPEELRVQPAGRARLRLS